MVRLHRAELSLKTLKLGTFRPSSEADMLTRSQTQVIASNTTQSSASGNCASMFFDALAHAGARVHEFGADFTDMDMTRREALDMLGVCGAEYHGENAYGVWYMFPDDSELVVTRTGFEVC